MRPPVETPNMKSPLFRISYVPEKQAETNRISVLSSGLVPFIVSSPYGLLRKPFSCQWVMLGIYNSLLLECFDFLCEHLNLFFKGALFSASPVC